MDEGEREAPTAAVDASSGTRARVRQPMPVLKRRIASGRGATEQPNATGDGAARLTPRVWIALAATGIAAGLCGDALMALLYGVEHAAFGYHSGLLVTAAARDSDLRRVVVLVVGGVIGGVGWYLVRRALPRERADLDEAVWGDDHSLDVRRSVATSVLSEVVIGMGASLGREAAPKLMGGVAGSVAARLARLSPAQRRLLLACGGGAGLAAVYNIPLAGGLFAAEVLLGSVTLPVVLPALACAGVASVTAWLYLPDRPTYLDVPAYHTSASLLVFALLAGLVAGLVATGYVRLIGVVSYYRPSGRGVLVALPLATGALGLVGIAYPELFGNGKGLAHDAFLGAGGLGLYLVLAVLKPLATALCLGAGGSGGLFTPSLATGAALGAGLGGLWLECFHGGSVGACALIGAAAVLAAATQAPLTGIVAVIELTDTGLRLALPLLAAVVVATVITRLLDGYSIYSARLEAA